MGDPASLRDLSLMLELTTVFFSCVNMAVAMFRTRHHISWHISVPILDAFVCELPVVLLLFTDQILRDSFACHAPDETFTFWCMCPCSHNWSHICATTSFCILSCLNRHMPIWVAKEMPVIYFARWNLKEFRTILVSRPNLSWACA